MKKTFKILSAIFLSTMMLALAGCGVVENLIGPENEWEQFDYTYATNSGSVELNCFVMFTSNNVEVEADTSANPKMKTIEPGLTVLVKPKAAVNQELLAELFDNSFSTSNYVIKTFPLDTDVEVEEEDASTGSFKATKTKWTLLYNGVKWTAKSRSSTAKSVIAANTEFDLSKIEGNFSWKKILGNFIVDNLL